MTQPRLEYRRDALPRSLNDYGPDENIPPFVEYVPGPGQWYLDDEPISDEQAEALWNEHVKKAP